MNSTAMPVSEIPALDHDEAMAVAEVEYGRLLDAVDRLRPEDWARPTDCVAWDVKAILAHLLGMMERLGDPAEAARQEAATAARVQATGAARIDALTSLQVETHAHLAPDELAVALRAAAPGALAARRETSIELRASVYDPGPPFVGQWTLGYLLDVILTRDPWLHRVDIARATGTEPVLTAEHDGRIVSDVVADWARRHGQAFTLTLTGLAGGTFVAGYEGERYELPAVEFCRILSGRAGGAGLLAEEVPF
jgi:uncharacterized protein (TIGR03083 family)